MGNASSMEIKHIKISEMFNEAVEKKVTPDITIEDSLFKYSGINSAAVLEHHSSQMVSDLVSKVPDYMTNLGSSLSAFKHVPNAVGLGALVISFLLHLMASLVKVPEDSTLNMIEQAIAKEKAKKVRDTMDEYLKRLCKHLQEPQEALKETKRLEKQLSEQLTRLRNSMLKDGQMSSRAMKIWTNGAAFHAQMLIHEARLMMAGYGSKEERNLDVRVASVCRMMDYYQKDLEKLLDEYKSYKRTNLKLYMIPAWSVAGYGHAAYEGPKCYVYDGELKKSAPIHYNTICHESSDAYINHMFSHWDKMIMLNKYFTILKTNINKLITQNSDFHYGK